ncbi:MAG: DUF642 domain-containing protein, partial [Akkermansiaceae bacterium]|nr:DUF642 domain-containing protein [Verrucomicrobiales bacterium]
MKTRTRHVNWLSTLLVLAFSAIALSARGQSTAYLYDAPGRLTSINPQSPGAPTIVVPPAVHLLGGNGNASFSVVAAGSGTLSYQWLSNGVPVPGAMNDTLVITNLTVPGNLVSNGGFETPIVLDEYLLYPAGQNLGGWVIESGNVDLCHSVWISAEGAQSLDLNGTTIGIVYQDVPTLPGQQYFLRYALAGNVYAGFAVKTNAVWWDGAPLATNTFNITGRSTADMGWTNREYAVTATAANTRIRFVSQSTTAAGSVLDDVTLIPVTPPPAAFSVIVSNAGGSVTSLVATVEFDLDRNGLADSWERNYFGATGQLNLGDHDGDGVSNQDEFLDGTDPTQPASFNPRLNLAVSGNGSVHAAPLQLSYEFNDLVPLRAIPGADSLFIRWRGLTNTSPEVNLVMNSTKNLTAEFGLTLTNGTTQDGTVQRGGTNTYAFMMNAGDTVIFRGGELSGSVSFAPWLRIYGLNGALLDSDANASDAYVEYRATNSGTFSLTVSSTGSLQTGDYRLSFTKAPGTFVILPGDEGGSLTNGANHDGITALGDEDLWTFNATAGNNIVLRCGQLAGAGPNGYFPYLRLYGPTGALLANVANDNDTYLTYQTTNSGTFAVVVGSYYRGDTGAYRLRLMQVPGAFVISPGDDGGALTNGANHDGVSDLGDEDLWTFTANAKDSIVLRCGQLSGAGPNGYYPYLRLYGP